MFDKQEYYLDALESLVDDKPYSLGKNWLV